MSESAERVGVARDASGAGGGSGRARGAVWRVCASQHETYRHTWLPTSSNVGEIELTMIVALLCAGIAAIFECYTLDVSIGPESCLRVQMKLLFGGGETVLRTFRETLPNASLIVGSFTDFLT